MTSNLSNRWFLLRAAFFWAICVVSTCLAGGQSPAPQQPPDQGTDTRDLKPVHPPKEPEAHRRRSAAELCAGHRHRALPESAGVVPTTLPRS